MAFDAFFLSAVLEEIQTVAAGARVEKIHQPSRDTVILLLRCESGRNKLLFAPNPAAPRLHLTSAVRRSVARIHVKVKRPEAIRAVISGCISQGFNCFAAVGTGEAAVILCKTS